MSNVKRLTKGFIFKTISTVLVSVFGLAISVMLNRHFGPEKYGLLILVYTVTAFCFCLSDLGSVYTLNRFVPKNIESGEIENAGSVIRVGIFLQFVGATFFAAALFIFSGAVAMHLFHRSELSGLLKAGSVFILGFCLVNFMFQIFQSLQIWFKEGLLNAVYLLLYLLFATASIFVIKAGLKGVLFSNALAAFICVCIGIKIIPKKMKAAILNFSGRQKFKTDIKTTFSFGGPLLLGAFLFYLMMWFDKTILGIYRSNAELTFYYIAFQFFNLFMQLIKIAATVLMPYLGEISNSPQEVIKSKFEIIFKWYAHLVLLSCIVLFFVIKPIIIMLYGKSYSPSIFIFQLLLVPFAIRALGNPQGMFLVNVFGKSKKSLKLSGLAAFLFVVSNLLLVPRYGYIGAIISSIVAYGVVGIIYLVWVKEIRQIVPFRTFGKIVISFGLVILIYLCARAVGLENIYLYALALPFVYLFFLKIFRCIDARDIDLTKKMFGALKVDANLR